MLVLMQDMGINLTYLMSLILKLSINKTIDHWIYNWSRIYKLIKALREKCPNAEFFWYEFSCIRTEYRKIHTTKNSVFGYFSHSEVDTEGFVLNWENLPNDWLPKQNKYSVELTNSHGPLLKIQWKNFFFLFSHKPRPVQTSFVNQVMRDHWSSGHSRLRRRY